MTAHRPRLQAPAFLTGRRGTALYLGAAGVAWVIAGVLQHGSP